MISLWIKWRADKKEADRLLTLLNDIEVKASLKPSVVIPLTKHNVLKRFAVLCKDDVDYLKLASVADTNDKVRRVVNELRVEAKMAQIPISNSDAVGEISGVANE